MDDGRIQGRVVRLITSKGFGFIEGDDGQERFFHCSEVLGVVGFAQLNEGQAVVFEHEKGPKGARAVNVRVVSG